MVDKSIVTEFDQIGVEGKWRVVLSFRNLEPLKFIAQIPLQSIMIKITKISIFFAFTLANQIWKD